MTHIFSGGTRVQFFGPVWSPGQRSCPSESPDYCFVDLVGTRARASIKQHGPHLELQGQNIVIPGKELKLGPVVLYLAEARMSNGCFRHISHYIDICHM